MTKLWITGALAALALAWALATAGPAQARCVTFEQGVRNVAVRMHDDYGMPTAAVLLTREQTTRFFAAAEKLNFKRGTKDSVQPPNVGFLVTPYVPDIVMFLYYDEAGCVIPISANRAMIPRVIFELIVQEYGAKDLPDFKPVAPIRVDGA